MEQQVTPNPSSTGSASAGPIITLLMAILVLASAYHTRVADADLWGHILYGELASASPWSAPQTDPFAYTAADHPWIAHERLAQIALYLTYRQGGVAGLILLKTVIALLTTFILYRTVRLYTSDTRIILIPVLLCAVILGLFFQIRPQIFTFLFLALFSHLAHLYIRRGHNYLWLAPPLVALWANVHGGFIAGTGLLAGWALTQSVEGWLRKRPESWRQAKMFAAAALLSTFASLLNPYGIGLWRLLREELSNPYNRTYIVEWAPWDPRQIGWHDGLFITMLILLLLAFTGAAGKRRLHHLLLTLPLAAYAFWSLRHIPLFVIVAAPALADLGHTAYARLTRGRWQRWVILLASALALFPSILVLLQIFALGSAPRLILNSVSFGPESPTRAVEFLRLNQLEGRAFNPLWWGSYISWHLGPEVQVSMDGRNDTRFPVLLVGDNLQYFREDDTRLDAVADAPVSSGAEMLLAPHSSPVVARLREDRRWLLVYEDEEALIFLRADAPAAAGSHTWVMPPPARKQHFP